MRKPCKRCGVEEAYDDYDYCDGCEPIIQEEIAINVLHKDVREADCEDIVKGGEYIDGHCEGPTECDCSVL